MPTFNFRVDSAGQLANGNIAVTFTSGFGALPATPSGHGMESGQLQDFIDLATETQNSLESIALGLLLLWIKQTGIASAAAIAGHTLTLTVNAGSASLSVA